MSSNSVQPSTQVSRLWVSQRSFLLTDPFLAPGWWETFFLAILLPFIPVLCFSILETGLVVVLSLNTGFFVRSGEKRLFLSFSLMVEGAKISKKWFGPLDLQSWEFSFLSLFSFSEKWSSCWRVVTVSRFILDGSKLFMQMLTNLVKCFYIIARALCL